MWSPLLSDHLFYCKTLLFRGYFFGDIGGYEKERENISPPIQYTELKAHIKNGEPDKYLMYFLYYP